MAYKDLRKTIKDFEKAGQLQTIGKAAKKKIKNGELVMNMTLPRQGVSLLKLDW